MPFWSKGNDSSQPASKDFSSADEAAFTHEDTMPTSMAAPAVGGADEMQQVAMAIQQQAIIQATINELADRAFAKCITKPSDSFGSSDAACVEAVTNKWLDSNQFMVKRMQKKMAAQSEQSFA